MFRRMFYNTHQVNALSTRLSLVGRLARTFCEEVQSTDGEKTVSAVLRIKFPSATTIQVTDISGGCGSMYEICIEADIFKGLRTVKQHKMVTEALKAEIKEMHGLRITTKIPDVT